VKEISEKKRKIIRGSITLILLVAFFSAIILVLFKSGIFSSENPVEDIKKLIEMYPNSSYLSYILIQYLQVVILPIPAAVTTTAGVVVFGAWKAFWLSYFACMLGALTTFFIGRSLGKKVIAWIIGKDDLIKWSKKLAEGKYSYFLMMLFPFFPDDILCFVVGTTEIKFTFFLITNIITRAIAIGTTCFFTSGSLIPLEGWGIPVLIVIAIIVIVILILSFKYERKVDEFMKKIEKKLSKFVNKITKRIDLDDKNQ